jgi:hypothetical protein
MIPQKNITSSDPFLSCQSSSCDIELGRISAISVTQCHHVVHPARGTTPIRQAWLRVVFVPSSPSPTVCVYGVPILYHP